MNEEVINDLYNNAVSKGYKKGREEFVSLLQSNDAVMNDMYSYVQSKGYKKGVDEFRGLIGATVESPMAERPVAEVKKKEDTASPFLDGGSERTKSDGLESLAVKVQDESILTKKPREAKPIVSGESTKVVSPKGLQKEEVSTELDKNLEEFQASQKKGGKSYLENIAVNLGLGASYANEAVLSIPESVVNILAIPQNYIAEKTGLPIGVTAEGIKKSWGITNPLLDYVKEDQKILSGEVSKFMADRYEDPSIVGNFEKGNYKDGFELLGSAITQSVPISVGLMIGGAYTAPSKLATVATLGFTEDQRESLAEMDPTMSEAEKTLKAAGMAGAESVFSSIGTATIGKVYRDIAKREGTEAAKGIFRDGLVQTYKKALEKTGVVAGFVGEGIEEAATQITQNLISGRPAFEGAADAFVTGAGSGVVFTAPISAVNAKRYIENKITSYDTKRKVTEILKDKADNMAQVYNVPVSSEINVTQLEIANLPNSRNLLINNLKKSVSDGQITEEDAKQSLFVFDKVQQVSNSVKDLDISVDDKAKVASLLRQRDDLRTKIQNKDDVLVVQEKRQIEEINNQIQSIISKPKSTYKVDGKDVSVDAIDELIKTKSKDELLAMNIEINNDQTGLTERLQSVLETKSVEQDAIQEQAAGEVPVQPGATVSEEVAQGVPQAEPQGVAEEGVQEIIPQEEIDLETQLAEDLDVIKGTTQPRLRVEGIDIPAEQDINIETIESNLDKLPAYEVNFTTPEVSQDIQVNPIEESKSSIKEGAAESRTIESFQGVPMIVGMSDTLAAGTVVDSMGNPMEVEGGLLYNVLGKNKNAAWAGVTEEGARIQYNEALELYNNNKNLFEKLWAEGKLPNGHVPMAIMRMADTAVNSNEAVFRYLSPLVKSQPEANQQAALDALKGDIEVKKKVKQEATVKSANKLDQFISSKNINSLGQLLDAMVSDANSRAKGDTENTLSLSERSLLFDLMVSPKGTKAASKNTVNALFGAKKDPKSKAFLADNIYEAIGEPAMLRIPRGNVAAVVGVDVLNGGVVPVEHGNYGFGPKGQMISLISNPKHGLDVFPEWKAKAVRVFKKTNTKKGEGKLPTASAIADEVGGAFFIDSAFRNAKVSMEPSDIELLAAKLRFAFPDVTVSNSQEEFDRVLQEEGVRTKESDGKVILGLTKDGKVYLNPDSDSLATPIHEFGHIWIDFLRSEVSKEKGDALLAKGLSLVEGTKALQQAIAKYGDNALAREEALVELMATKGEDIINKSKKKEFKNWLNALFKYVKEFFTTTEQLFKDKEFKKILQEMSLDDFINIGLADLLKGKAISSEFKAKDAGKGATELRFRVGDNVTNFISKARAQGFSEAAIKNVLTRSGVDTDAIDTALAKDTPAAKKVEVTEEFAPGYDRMIGQLEGVVEKSLDRGTSQETAMENAINYLEGTKVYENATDVQREQMVRDVRNRFKKREKRAPSAEKVVGKPKKKKVTVDEMAALKDQIKLEARAAREAKGDLNTKRKMIADAINKVATEGNIGVKKVEAMLKRLTKLNVDSPTVVNKFIDYAFKVFQDAEYASKLSKAKSLKSNINKISKNKEKFANLRDLGSKFVAIDPSMLTSTELVEYNEIAEKIYKSIQGSNLKGKGNLVDMVVEAEANKYIDGVVEKQQKQILEESIAEMSELLGVELTQEEYFKLMDSQNVDEQLNKKYNEADIRASIEKSFDLYSTMIDESISSGKDLFTGEEVNYSDIQKKTIQEFIKMDINLLNTRAALEAVDALMNFINNGSIAKMNSVLSKYNGQKNMIDAVNDGVKSRPVKKYFSKGLGKVLLEQTANINIVFERVFGGFTRGQKMEEAMGVADLVNGKAKGQKDADIIVEEYINKYFKTKPNKQEFNTAENNIERGMGAFMSRNINGTDAEIKAEFQRRKDLILKVNANGERTGSIAELEKGNEQEVEKARIYQQIYDKILSDSNTVEDVQSKMDKTNLEAIEFWQNKWRDKYQDLSDVALGIYNKVLDKDTNFTPDRYSKLSSSTSESTNLLNEDMAFLVNTGNSGLYKKETGVLMAPTRPKKLPTDTKSGEANRYIDLSFDSNNSNAMYDALVDINTAGAIRQIDAAMNSAAFRKIMANQNDANLVRNRINLYVNNVRNKNPFSNSELKNFTRRLNRISAIGVGQALGGITQPIKQTIPIAVNTFINAGSLDVKSIFDKSKQDFMSRSGRAIANRGIESQAQVSTLNKMVDEISKSRGEKLFRGIEMVNKWWLKNLLVKWDVGIARASWMTYYEQSLKKQGINPNSIDYNTHEVNEKAANYAQRQVDRQQNVSDADMAGELLSSKEPITQVVTKMLMPFSSFRMNQSARLGSDLAVLMDLSSDSNDRKIAARSVAGFAFEMVTFRALSAGVLIMIYDLVKSYIVDDEDDEDREKKIDSLVKGQLTSTVADMFSPIPIADPVVQGGASALLESYQDMLDVEEGDRISIYGDSKKDVIQSFGTFGIAAGRAMQLYEMGQLASGEGFKDSFNRTKYIPKEYREALKTLFIPAIMSNIGLAPSEVNSIVRTTISEAKKNSSTNESGEKSKKSSGGGGRSKTINKSDLKKYYPELSRQIESATGDEIKAIEKQIRDIKKNAKDQMYGGKD